MHYRRLGKAGMKVSAISLGAWINLEKGKMPVEDAKAIVRTAYEAGINFFDIADVYGFGTAEELMGELLAEYSRNTLIVSTKVYFEMSEDVNDRGLSRKHILESIDRSLKRLNMDYIDIYFCHRADPETEIFETARAMHTLIEQGKVLYWGTSKWRPEQIVEVCEICERYGLHPPYAEQPQYSMFYREDVEQNILPVAQKRGIGLTTYSPLAMGLLSGKYDNGIPDGSRFDKEAWSKERFDFASSVEKAKKLKPIADDLGITRAQLATAWLLRKNGVSSVITGASRAGQVSDNAAAADVELSEDVLAKIEDVLAG